MQQLTNDNVNKIFNFQDQKSSLYYPLDFLTFPYGYLNNLYLTLKYNERNLENMIKESQNKVYKAFIQGHCIAYKEKDIVYHLKQESRSFLKRDIYQF